MNENSFAAIDMLLCRRNITLQMGVVVTDKDVDALLEEIVSYELGDD